MHLLIALSYPLGVLFVIVMREELFTEQTTIAVIPVLSRKRRFKSLLRLWAIVLVGKLIGCFYFIHTTLPFEMLIIKPEAYQHIAEKFLIKTQLLYSELGFCRVPYGILLIILVTFVIILHFQITFIL